MRRQWPCSKCGFACSSTWRSMNPIKPVVCNSCKSKANSTATDPSIQVVATENPDIKPSTLLIRENNPLRKVDPGHFVFGTKHSDPVRVDQHEPTSKGKGKAIASGDGQGSGGIEDRLHAGLTLKSPSTLVETEIQYAEINADAAKQAVLEELEKLSFWNTGNVKKKKRTKLPQFTPSPKERFANEMYHSSKGQETMNNIFPNENDQNPLYDDVLIYQKCSFIPENEIGLGAMLLPVPPQEAGEPMSSALAKVVVKKEPSEVADPPESSKKDNKASYMIQVKKSLSEEMARGEESPSRHMNSTSRQYKSLNEIFAHIPGESSTGIGRRPRGRPPRALRNSDEVLQPDSSSLVDVPSTYPFDENTADIRTTTVYEVEALDADGERMTSLSIPEEDRECSVLYLLDSGDGSEKTLWSL